MSEFISLTCPSCGGKLQITSDVERFACANCGNEHLVHRNHGIVTLLPVIEEVKGVRQGVDKTASELALVRLRAELETLHAQKQSISGGISYLFLCISFGLISLFALFILVANINVVSVATFIVSLMFPLLFFFLYKRETKKKTSKVDQINKTMSSKEKEYLQHLKIVQK